MTTIIISDLTTNNPMLILAAMAWNATYALAAFALVALRALLGLALTVAHAAGCVLVAAARLAVAHWRLLAMLAGLVAGVIVAALFWWVVMWVGISALGMYAGLMAITR